MMTSAEFGYAAGASYHLRCKNRVDPDVPLRRERELVCVIVAKAEETAMSSRFASTGTAKAQLRDRIIKTYQRAHRTIAGAAASPSANTHAAMTAYDKACEHLHSDVLRASELFPDTDALLDWLMEDIADDAFGEQDRISFSLNIRTMMEETEKQQRAPWEPPAGIQNL
jgi:hypothetical protein